MLGNTCSISLMALLGAMPFAGIAADGPVASIPGTLAQITSPSASSPGMAVNPLPPLSPIDAPVSGSTPPAGAMGPIGTTPPNDVTTPNTAVYPGGNVSPENAINPGNTVSPESAINPGSTIAPGGVINPGSVIDNSGTGTSSTGQ